MDFHMCAQWREVMIAGQFWSCLEFFPAGGPELMTIVFETLSHLKMKNQIFVMVITTSVMVFVING